MNMERRQTIKRIVIFASAFHPSLGGVEELVRQLALEYQTRGLEVMVVTNRWPRSLPPVEDIGGVSVRRYPLRLPDGGSRARWSFRLTSRRILRELLAAVSSFQPDVLHVQCVSANGWYASRVASRLGVPMVVSSQGERTMDAAGIYQRSAVMNRVLLETLGCASWVTACSAATLRDLQKFAPSLVRDSQATVVYNGIGSEAFLGQKPAQNGRPYILALGRLVPQKGFHVLIEAMASAGLGEVELLLGGDGEEFQRLQSRIVDLGLLGRVRLVGRLDRERVHALVGASVGVVVPSLREPMGIVVLEALAAGKPLVASRVDGILEIVPNGPGVRLVKPGSAEELADGLLWLRGFSGFGPLQEHIRHARGFLWERIAEEYLGIYQNCLAKENVGIQPMVIPKTNCLESNGGCVRG